jgi:glycine betaine transporter
MVGPSLFSMTWFSIFGTAGIQLDNQTNGKFSETLYNDGVAVALFQFLDAYPLALLTSILALFLVFIFFVAGADAGTVVLGSMSAGGVLNPKVTIKLTWGVIMALIAAVLLVAGGGGSDALNGLTNGAILAATPFGILMVPMCYGLYKTLQSDRREEERREMQEIIPDRPAPTRPAPGGPTAQQMTAEDPQERGQGGQRRT